MLMNNKSTVSQSYNKLSKKQANTATTACTTSSHFIHTWCYSLYRSKSIGTYIYIHSRRKQNIHTEQTTLFCLKHVFFITIMYSKSQHSQYCLPHLSKKSQCFLFYFQCLQYDPHPFFLRFHQYGLY